MNILVTGCCGFIGFHTCKIFIENTDFKIYGIDDLNSYYDVNLKKSRLSKLKDKNFFFKKLNISDYKSLYNFLKNKKISIIINLAAQAGVRYSIKKPNAYFESNIKGFYNILEVSKIYKISHLIYASTSSVYGDTKNFPTNEKNNTDKPLSFYSASKKTNEILAYSYSAIHQIKTTGLRFFTVYGPYGRPDMAIYKFANAIKNEKTLELYNNGNHYRDFTYVDDIVKVILQLTKKNIIKSKKEKVPFDIFNIGNSNSEKITNIIKIIESHYNKKAKIKNLNMQVGDVYKTHSDSSKISKFVKEKMKTSIEKGLNQYLDWFDKFYD